MRYTTIIDISEIPAVYRNQHAVKIYLHMVLKCGYHDDDRDIIRLSLREMSYRLDISLSAVRHAVRILERYQLIRRVDSVWRVNKFVATNSRAISKRSSNTTRDELAKQERERLAAEREQEEKKAAAFARRHGGKSSFQVYLDTLKVKADAGDVDARLLYEKYTKKSKA